MGFFCIMENIIKELDAKYQAEEKERKFKLETADKLDKLPPVYTSEMLRSEAYYHSVKMRVLEDVREILEEYNIRSLIEKYAKWHNAHTLGTPISNKMIEHFLSENEL